MEMELNQEQKDAAKEIFSFLAGSDKYLILDGPGGTGKSYLVSFIKNQVIEEFNKLAVAAGLPFVYKNCTITATTNKAAAVLSATAGCYIPTIHSFIKVKPVPDLKTGTETLKIKADYTLIHNEIVFIDEASMIDRELFRLIDNTFQNDCKVIFVGDKCQLAPVKESESCIYSYGFPEINLSMQMRFGDSPNIQDQCKHIRTKIMTNDTSGIDIYLGPDISAIDNITAKNLIDNLFLNSNNNSKIVTYTNSRAIEYCDYIIKDLRQRTDYYTKGDVYYVNSASTGSNLYSDQELIIAETATDNNIEEHLILDEYPKVKLLHISVQDSRLFYPKRIFVPYDKEEFNKLLKYMVKKKKWREYYYWKDVVIDLRLKDSSTIHKAQGSTFDNVIVDLDSFTRCTQPLMALRLFYVAVSRARKHIYFKGNLKPRFGRYIDVGDKYTNQSEFT